MTTNPILDEALAMLQAGMSPVPILPGGGTFLATGKPVTA